MVYQIIMEHLTSFVKWLAGEVFVMSCTRRVKWIVGFVVIAALMILQNQVIAAGFGWSANAEEDLAGYKIYYGTDSRNYTNSVDVGNVTSWQLPQDFPVGTWYFAVKAYDNDAEESDYSNELKVTWNGSSLIKFPNLRIGPQAIYNDQSINMTSHGGTLTLD
jgi:hypothetical protein